MPLICIAYTGKHPQPLSSLDSTPMLNPDKVIETVQVHFQEIQIVSVKVVAIIGRHRQHG